MIHPAYSQLGLDGDPDTPGVYLGELIGFEKRKPGDVVAYVEHEDRAAAFLAGARTSGAYYLDPELRIEGRHYRLSSKRLWLQVPE